MVNCKRFSIAGAQEKLSFLLEKIVLRLIKEGGKGTYTLKLISRYLKKVDQVPANEHLTMQIAKQVYGLNTAENAMIFIRIVHLPISPNDLKSMKTEVNGTKKILQR